MLMRSASTPLLDSASWVSNPVAAAAPCDQLFSITTHRPSSPSISHCSLLTSPASLSSSSASSRPRTVLARAQSEGDLSKFQLAEVPKRRSCLFSNSGLLPSISLEEDAEMELEKDPSAPPSTPVLLRRVLTNSGLDAGAIMMQLAEGSLMENGYCAAVWDEDESEPPPAAGTTGGRDSIQLVNDGCAGGGGRGGKMCGGRRGPYDKDEEGFGLSDGADNNCDDGLDAYYVRMVKADPRNPLVLGNYAKFLTEVLGDLDKAQVYCERAILAGAGAGVDAGVLSMYADIIWKTSRDTDRADTYFNQALQAAPDDCYVAASYAHFLWDAEEEEEEAAEEEETEISHHQHLCHPSSALSQQGRTPTPPIAAPS